MLENKRSVQWLRMATECKLNWRQNLIFSYLMQWHRLPLESPCPKPPKGLRSVREFLHIDGRTLAKNWAVLKGYGLVFSTGTDLGFKGDQKQLLLRSVAWEQRKKWWQYTTEEQVREGASIRADFATFPVYIPTSQKALPLLHSVIWNALLAGVEQKNLPAEIFPAMDEYDPAKPNAKREVRHILQKLKERGLIDSVTDELVTKEELFDIPAQFKYYTEEGDV